MNNVKVEAAWQMWWALFLRFDSWSEERAKSCQTQNTVTLSALRSRPPAAGGFLGFGGFHRIGCGRRSARKKRSVVGSIQPSSSRANQTSMSFSAVVFSPNDHPARLVVINNG